MSIFNKLDDSYERNHNHFIVKLRDFHSVRGNPLGRIPNFGGQPLDLFALYNTVTSFGGVESVTKKGKWNQVFNAIGLPPGTNADFALRQHYSRYLEAYERIFFLGEEADEKVLPTKTCEQNFKFRRLNRATRFGPLGERHIHNFDRISYSLQSGLENEVDFALNICALLSNVTNSIFNLAKSFGVLDLILAHGGLWSIDDPCGKELYDCWYNNSQKNFAKFWCETITLPFIKDLYNEIYPTDIYMDEKTTKLLVDADHKPQKKAPEFARILQICLILHNFSFDQINAMYLAQHCGAKRFLLFTSCSVHCNIKKTCLDTLDNIAEHIILDSPEHWFTQSLLQLIHLYIISDDKHERFRAKSLIAKLSRSENTNIISDHLSHSIYTTIVSTLSLPDISLLMISLDALYSLSGLCESTATAISLVHGSIGVLVCLLTVHAESFGNQAIQGYRILENKHSMFTPKNQLFLASRQLPHPQQSMNQMPVLRPRPMFIPRSTHPHQLPPNIPLPLPMPTQSCITSSQPKEELVELDTEIFTVNWMSGFYEPHPNNNILLADIYKDYTATCSKLKRSGCLPFNLFEIVLREILPPNLAQIMLLKGQLTVSGIQRRNVPVEIQGFIPKSRHDQLLLNKPVIRGVTDQLRNEAAHKTEVNTSDVSTDMNIELLSSERLKSGAGCMELMESIKLETQSHFMQFHLHRQHLHAIQMQIHQLMQTTKSDLPENLIKDVQSRALSHQQQMQLHHQKLQQLSSLMEQVQSRIPKDLTPANQGTENNMLNCIDLGTPKKSTTCTSSPQSTTIPIPLPSLLNHSPVHALSTAISQNHSTLQHNCVATPQGKRLHSPLTSPSRSRAKKIPSRVKKTKKANGVISNGLFHDLSYSPFKSATSFNRQHGMPAVPVTSQVNVTKNSTGVSINSNETSFVDIVNQTRNSLKVNCKEKEFFRVANQDLTSEEKKVGENLVNGHHVESNGTFDDCSDVDFHKHEPNVNHTFIVPQKRKHGTIDSGLKLECESKETPTNGKLPSPSFNSHKHIYNNVANGINERRSHLTINSTRSYIVSPTVTKDETKTFAQPLNGLRLPTTYRNTCFVSTGSEVNSKKFTSLERRLSNFPCKWEGCVYSSSTSQSKLFEHIVQSHVPPDGKLCTCKIADCSPVQRFRGSLIVHIQEKHLTLPFVPLYECEEESPVTRSVRLTAALILRNISMQSPHGKRLIMTYENMLATVAMSTSECASAASECLYELHCEKKRDGSNGEDL